MRMFLSLMLSVSFVSSIFAVNYHPISLCYEGGWEESCPAMDCCVTLSANSSELCSLFIQPAYFESNPAAINFDLLSEQFAQDTSLPPNGALLWLAQKISLP